MVNERPKTARTEPSKWSLAVPSCTVFISSFCIMVLELVAGRIIARQLGSSLYTWTSVIGVVLAGITLGNYLGGRLADRFAARKALAVLFTVASVACVSIVVFNNLVGNWVWILRLSWPMHVLSQVTLVFLLPSTLLGTISPVAAKMALDRGLPPGRTVGSIYAWGAAGSIAGTFITGYYLIAAVGSIAIVWMVAGALLLMALLFGFRLWALYIWALLLLGCLTIANAPWGWAYKAGTGLALREPSNPDIIYEDESPYSYIAISRFSSSPDRRAFMLDKLKHSEVIMDDVLNLQYFYTQIYAVITGGLKAQQDPLTAMAIGGGGYVYPRYLQKLWPHGRIDVVEIDPAVTEAAIRAFGLEADTKINTYHMDARNFVDKLLEQERRSGQRIRYDFIYEDAINDYSVPYQLMTVEFNDKISGLLTDKGVYLINLIDIFDSGLFLGAVINTLEQTFDHVYVLAEAGQSRANRNTFVIVATQRKIAIEQLISRSGIGSRTWCLNPSQIEQLKKKASGLVLTDDYAPVENLLAPVVREGGKYFLARRYQQQADALARQNKFDEAIAKYRLFMQADPAMTVRTYMTISLLLHRQSKFEEEVEALRQAIAYNNQAETKVPVADIHFRLGGLLKRLGKNPSAVGEFEKAAQGLRQQLQVNPRSVALWRNLGQVLQESNQLEESTRAFRKTLELDSGELSAFVNLAKVLEIQQRFDEAIAVVSQGVKVMDRLDRQDDVSNLQEYREFLEFRKTKQRKKIGN